MDTLCFGWGDTGTGWTSSFVGSIGAAMGLAGPELKEGDTGTGSTSSDGPAGLLLGSILDGGTTFPVEAEDNGGGETVDQNEGCCGPGPHPRGP